MKFVVCCAALLSSSMAATFVVTGDLTEKSAYHMHEAFIQNSGAKVDAVPYTKYKLVLGTIKNVESKDIHFIAETINAWLRNHAKNVHGLKVLLNHAESDGQKVIIRANYATSTLAVAYDGLYQTIDCPSCAKAPSGKSYHFDSAPYVYVGDIKGFSPKKVLRSINRRLTQSGIIHKDKYFEVDVNSLKIESVS